MYAPLSRKPADAGCGQAAQQCPAPSLPEPVVVRVACLRLAAQPEALCLSEGPF